jgi:hypothetical protein
MRDHDDNLNRRLRELDPVRPGELDGTGQSGESGALMARILATDPEASPEDSIGPERRRSWLPKLVLAPVALVAAAAVLFVVIGLPGGSGSGDGGGGSAHVGHLASALDTAAASAAAQSGPSGDRPYGYLKTREMSVSTNGNAGRSWKVQQSTTREEWVTRDGSGRMRIVAGPSEFVDASDRTEWEGAGRPEFLALGFGPRTEVHWLAGGPSLSSVETLPTEPAELAARLLAEAEADHGEISVAAAALGQIAEDLRNPDASPALREALYKAAKQLPGIRYLGKETDAAGRSGVAIGVADGTMLYSLIFDPGSADVLATETTSTAPTIAPDHESPTLVRATVYLESRGVESRSEYEGAWLS